MWNSVIPRRRDGMSQQQYHNNKDFILCCYCPALNCFSRGWIQLEETFYFCILSEFVFLSTNGLVNVCVFCWYTVPHNCQSSHLSIPYWSLCILATGLIIPAESVPEHYCSIFFLRASAIVTWAFQVSMSWRRGGIGTKPVTIPDYSDSDSMSSILICVISIIFYVFPLWFQSAYLWFPDLTCGTFERQFLDLQSAGAHLVAFSKQNPEPHHLIPAPLRDEKSVPLELFLLTSSRFSFSQPSSFLG